MTPQVSTLQKKKKGKFSRKIRFSAEEGELLKSFVCNVNVSDSVMFSNRKYLWSLVRPNINYYYLSPKNTLAEPCWLIRLSGLALLGT